MTRLPLALLLFVAVVRRVWLTVALALSAAASLITGVYFGAFDNRPLTGLALSAAGCFLVLVFTWRDVRRSAASSPDPAPAPVRPDLHQLTSEITPQPRPGVGAEKQHRSQRLADIRRNAARKGNVK